MERDTNDPLLARKAREGLEREKRKPPFSPSPCSGEADPIISELRSLATTKYPLCPEARLMLEMAVDVQLGKPIDLQRMLPNNDISHADES